MKQESERGGGGREGGQQWLCSEPSNHLKIYVSELEGGVDPSFRMASEEGGYGNR
jgi:hypothetical protein